MKKILRNKKGVALESAIIFMVTIFTFCFLLSTVAIINSNQLRIEKIYTNNDYEVEQIGEYFLSYMNELVIPVCDAPLFTPGAGEYTNAQSVKITCTTPEVSIYYTLDGSEPTTIAGTLYSAPIQINSDCTLKAIAVCDGYFDSTVAGAEYTIIPIVNGGEPAADPESQSVNTVVLLMSPLSESQPVEDTLITACKSDLESKVGTEKYSFEISRSQTSDTMSFELKVRLQQSGELVLNVKVTKTANTTDCSLDKWIIN